MEHTYLGYANSGTPLWLTLEQRLRHIAVNGKTGYGKSTELKSVIAQDIARGDGVLLLDPAGTLAEEVLALVPPWRNNHVCYFNIADRDFPIGFNIYADVLPERRSTLAEQIVSAFKSIWFDMWGPQLERQLRASSLALLDTPGTSMVDILRLYFDFELPRADPRALPQPDRAHLFRARICHLVARLPRPSHLPRSQQARSVPLPRPDQEHPWSTRKHAPHRARPREEPHRHRQSFARRDR